MQDKTGARAKISRVALELGVALGKFRCGAKVVENYLKNLENLPKIYHSTRLGDLNIWRGAKDFRWAPKVGKKGVALRVDEKHLRSPSARFEIDTIVVKQVKRKKIIA